MKRLYYCVYFNINLGYLRLVPVLKIELYKTHIRITSIAKVFKRSRPLNFFYIILYHEKTLVLSIILYGFSRIKFNVSTIELRVMTNNHLIILIAYIFILYCCF